MASFYQYETADLRLTIDDGQGGTPLEGYDRIVVSIRQARARLDLTGDDLGVDVPASTINVHLTQEQTGAFEAAPAQVQVNVYYSDSERDVTAKGEVKVLDNLYKQVIA